MHALGTHLLIELKDCNSRILRDVGAVQDAMVAAAKAAQATIVGVSFHEFSPFGVSGVVVIAESHLTIHTWPEYRYAAADIFTCGDILQPEVAADHLIKAFQCKTPSVVEMKRGILSNGKTKLPHKVVEDTMESHVRIDELQMVP